MRRLHYSHGPLPVPYRVAQSAEPDEKPRGLWYSLDEEWLQFLRTDWGPELARVRAVSELEVDLSRLAVLDAREHLIAFDQAYGAPFVDEWGATLTLIRWDLVARDFAGVEVRFMAGTQWWLRRWDVHSGCVWDPSAVRVVSSTVFGG